mgnify:CR=1 FL=1
MATVDKPNALVSNDSKPAPIAKLPFHKVCNVFGVNFDYFLEDKKVFKIKNNTGVAVGDNAIVNTISEKLIQQYEERIKELKETIAELKAKK